MRRAAAGGLLVVGRVKPPRLRPFLDGGLGVARRLLARPQTIAPGAQDEVAGGLETAVDEDGADQRFSDVGEDRRLLAAAAARFAQA